MHCEINRSPKNNANPLASDKYLKYLVLKAEENEISGYVHIEGVEITSDFDAASLTLSIMINTYHYQRKTVEVER